MPHVSKVLTEEGLQKDLQYLVNGILVHQVLVDICPPRSGLMVLEPACGSGKLGLYYALRGSDVWLLDLDPGALKYSKELWRRALETTAPIGPQPWTSTVTYTQQSVMKLRFPDNTFDFTFNEGVAHMWGYNSSKDWRRQRCLNEMVRVTKTGGQVAIIGSNAHCPAMMKYAAEIDHTYVGMPPKQMPFTVEELRSRLIAAGLAPDTVWISPLNYWPSRWQSGALENEIYWQNSMLLVGYGTKPG